ncbi:MAG: hypothetical protein Q8J74_01035, partial [Candidatus Didemnitutus sp.]|nr:hypothetical protein [Candidatus Didemnitutus sp.]
MPRLLLPRILVLCSLLLVPATFVRATESTPATLIAAKDLLNLKQLDSPTLSPDGASVVYVVRSIELKPDAKDDWTYHTHLWIAAVDGSSAPRRLTFAGNNNNSPAWHPDGRRIAFVRGGSGPGERAQVHVLNLAGGEAEPVTQLETGAGNPRWSPDGKRLLFSSSLSYAQVRDTLEKTGTDATPPWSVEKPGRSANDTGNWNLKSGSKGKAASPNDDTKSAKLPSTDPDGSLAEMREWLAKNESEGSPRVTSRYNFLAEGDLQTELSFAQLYVQDDLPGAVAKPLAIGFEGKNAAEWMMDNQHLIYVAARDAGENPDRQFGRNSLYLIEIET